MLNLAINALGFLRSPLGRKIALAIAVCGMFFITLKAIYEHGEASGRNSVYAEYAERDAAAMKDVVTELTEASKVYQETIATWQKDNRNLVSAIEDNIAGTEVQIREIPVEKLITIADNCFVDYGVVELFDQISTASTADSD